MTENRLIQRHMAINTVGAWDSFLFFLKRDIIAQIKKKLSSKSRKTKINFLVIQSTEVILYKQKYSHLFVI